ncbi:glutathione S-transferase family protein [Acidiphilium sp. AL]|uniref:Glutathione S-transferase family protein n=1 Tax=Acidiphilium iwatense TaxID=768198 RepID=A0ABS9DU72_9PROT|nr:MULTISPECIES: glutathione S-transferase family protein [Acidiphilium]MCF3945340.1 glutathione S-transferase family protein [Acidiphilium iwatense]MCU4159366.1 glutathione S-transferase family protein [Acidiphilium sp. AL]
MYLLYARPGWGSALAEVQLDWYGLPYRIETVGDLFEDSAARERLTLVNPLAQIPTLVLPDGTVMTESAAITLHFADVTKTDSLVPAPGDPLRPGFLRWLVFLVANLYPTFTYADDPARFVAHEAARAGFRDAVDAYAQRLWRVVEQTAGTPYFLGDRLSALDIYLAIMTHWRPRRAWFAEHCPKLAAIAAQTDSNPRLASVWQRNFAAADEA